MKDKDKRPIYEPPRARDLSAVSVSGQRPCMPGGSPFGLCKVGATLAPPGPCSNGQSPHAPNCKTGSIPSA